MFENALTDKKKLTCIVITAIVVVVVVAAGTVFVLKTSSKSSNDDKTLNTTNVTGDNLKTQGLEAMDSQDDTKAKELLQEAKEKYEAAGDTNNAIDAAALLNQLK